MSENNKPKFMYTAKMHVAYKLRQMSQEIPQNVLEIIRQEFVPDPGREQLDNKNIKVVSAKNIRDVLMEHNLYDYLESINNIQSKLNNPVVVLKNPEECCICYETTDNFMKLVCNHLFCEICLDKWEGDKWVRCPLCRNEQPYFKQVIIDNKQKQEILNYYEENVNNYRTGTRNIPFNDIISDFLDQSK